MACQSQFFLDSYDRAWATRLDMMRQMVANGAETPLEVIHRLKLFELTHVLQRDGQFGPRQWPESTREFLPTGTPVYKALPFLGQFHPVPFYDDHVDFLLHVLAQRQFDAVVELGSGYGRNLIELYSRGGPKDVAYFAGEITPSGRAAADMLFAMLPRMKVTSFAFDHKAPDLSCLAGFHSVLLFSYHSIEQVAEIDADYFATLAKAAPKVTGIHFEPFGFQLADREGEPSQMQRELFERSEWNRNLAQRLVEAHNANQIALTFLGKEVAGGEPENATSLAVWENV